MAGEWIKFRSALPFDPRIVRMAEYLRKVGGQADDVNENTPMRVTLCVTVVALLRVWCMADEVGKEDGNDVVIPHTNAAQVTYFVDLYKFDEAMKMVGWIKDEPGGVRFPNLLKYNTIRSSSSMSSVERQRAYRERKKAASASSDRDAKSNVTRNVTDNVTLSSPLLSSGSKEGMQGEGSSQPPPETPFDRFWKVYPKRVQKKAAMKAWEANGCDAILDQIVRKVKKWAKSDDWTKEGKQYCPYPATWLNNHQWNDDDPVDPLAHLRKRMTNAEVLALDKSFGQGPAIEPPRRAIVPQTLPEGGSSNGTPQGGSNVNW